MLSQAIIKQLEYLGENDAGTGSSNWKEVESLALIHPLERAAIMRWVFQHYPGMYDPRNRAGEELRRTDEMEFWSLWQALFLSGQSNDRDYALEVLDNLMNEQYYNGSQLVIILQFARQLLLKDPQLFIRIKAAYCLRDIYTEEVRQVLQQILTTSMSSELSSSERRREKHLRNSAAKLLTAIDN